MSVLELYLEDRYEGEIQSHNVDCLREIAGLEVPQVEALHGDEPWILPQLLSHLRQTATLHSHHQR